MNKKINNTEEMKAGVGKCEDCKKFQKRRFDPSPAGVALSPGTLEETACAEEENLAKLEELGVDTSMWGDAEPCLLWETAVQVCKEHGELFHKEEGSCPECFHEEQKKIQEIAEKHGYRPSI